MKNLKYGFGKTVDYSFDDAIERVTEALKSEGFGILTEIDVKQTIKKKLDKDFHAYKILGACNPHLAYRVLENEDSIGLLLPCNVVVREDKDKVVHVEFMDPEVVMEMLNNPVIYEVAAEVKQRLERVMNNL